MKKEHLEQKGGVRRIGIALLLVFSSAVCAASNHWQRNEVNWRAEGGRRVKAVRFPDNKARSTFSTERRLKKGGGLAISSASHSSPALRSSVNVSASDTQIDSPPVAGFVPHIVVTATKERSDDFDFTAQPHFGVVGAPLTDSPETDFGIGLFDTGAGVHVMGYASAERLGLLQAGLLTSSEVELLGATGTIFAGVSQPLGLFIDGLAAVAPDGTLNDANMVGQSNVSLVVGQEPGDRPDLPTAIGPPLSVYFVTVIRNDQSVTVEHEGTEYTGPDLRFYDHFDWQIPEYGIQVPLNLIPAGGFNVQYIPNLEGIIDFVFEPGQPSTITGISAQSLFFANSVDLHQGSRSAIDKDRFMFDTGAQVTVISSSIAARLGLNPAEADFEVEIQDVTGEISMEPGFFLDLIEIPALGDWLSFTNVPVVMLDVDSAEGGYLEGIIGMNLFVEFNMVLRGGGLLGQDPPSLEIERISLPPAADIAPTGGDGQVDFLDVAALAAAWLSADGEANWNPRADIGPRQIPDGTVNNLDFLVLAAQWRDTTAPQP